MGNREMVTRQRESTSLWRGSKRGPWSEGIYARLAAALDEVVRCLRVEAAVSGVVLFGSYARGDHGRSSDVDLLILLDGATASGEDREVKRAILHRVSQIEADLRLPMHLAPLLAQVGGSAALSADLLHAVWTDGIVLYGRMSTLSRLSPTGLAPWTLVRFSVAHAEPKERVRLSRRLHGMGGKPGLVRPPGLVLGHGALLLPPEQHRSVRDALDEAGATYDLLLVWRET